MSISSYSEFFEGTEKVLEIWFTKKDGNIDDCDLRKIPRSSLEKILEFVKCQIISSRKTEAIDSYVLSESSMFVSKNRFILKTCGTTTLLKALKPLLCIVKSMTGFDVVLDLFYTRKNFMRPELQDILHANFENEAKLLLQMFPNGKAYCLGKHNEDCWYMFTLNPLHKLKGGVMVPDQTMEVIMHELDPQVMSIFTQMVSSSAKEATHKSGINELFPDMLIDDYLFEPCGYSMNGLLKGGYYMTIHVTPEHHCSYVSFETNYPQENYDELLRKVVMMFKPGKFLVTILANTASIVREKQLSSRHLSAAYTRQEYQLCHFKNYTLNYALYTKFPS